MYQTVHRLFANDWYSVIFSVTLLIGYHVFLAVRLKSNPRYTIQAATAAARIAWVENIMHTRGNEVLAAQTLRNSMMAATFMASTSVLLIIGTLTLTGQTGLREGWHALNSVGATHAEAWLTKVLVLLTAFVVAFFSFAMNIRVLHLVGYMINAPAGSCSGMISPLLVATYLNRAGKFYAFGIRLYYFSVPLAFWLFGPQFMVMATMVLLPTMYMLDRAPHPSEAAGGNSASR